MAKLLVVEDDNKTAMDTQSWLQQDKHIVDVVADGSSALDYLKSANYDLVVLDWNLPDITGLQLLKKMRASGCNTSVLMLTGFADMDHKVLGFENGVDDYLTKPFNPKELRLRIAALLRRSATARVETVISSGNLQIDTNSYKVLKDGIPVRLSPIEFNLLFTLVRNPRNVQSAEALLSQVWPADSDATPDQVRKYVRRLRDKLDSEGKPSSIRTVHGVGYAWEPE
jgi:DNA-binding response OmpR family regulator